MENINSAKGKKKAPAVTRARDKWYTAIPTNSNSSISFIPDLCNNERNSVNGT